MAVQPPVTGGGGESLLSSEQQKAIKTNRPTSRSGFPSVCLGGGGRHVKAFLGNDFFSRDNSEVTGVARRCENEFQQVTHTEDDFCPGSPTSPAKMANTRFGCFLGLSSKELDLFCYVKLDECQHQPLASFKNALLARSRDYKVLDFFFYTSF